MPKFATVVLDVDSTVSGVEGIDWLAARRGGETAAQIVALTERAMRGEIALEAVYGARLAEIRPTRSDIEALSAVYIEKIADGCVDTVRAMQDAGIRVVLVSGGIRQAIAPLALHIGVAGEDLSAVDIYFDARGVYAGFDKRSPLATTAGKPIVIEKLGLPRPILAAGDGSTDLAMKGTVDVFAAFTGFAARENVVRDADTVVASFAQLRSHVLED
jgi:phosphoserine phosphatase